MAALARIGRGASEAEDLVQDALFAIHSRRHTYDPTEPLGPFVHAIRTPQAHQPSASYQTSHADVPIDEAEGIVARDDHAEVESSHDLNRLLGGLPRKTRWAIQSVKPRELGSIIDGYGRGVIADCRIVLCAALSPSISRWQFLDEPQLRALSYGTKQK